MEKCKAAALIYGSYPHHLDHLATLCILLDIPLIVTEKALEKEASRYYPQLITFCISTLELAEQVTRSYQVIFSSLPKDLFDQIFFMAENLLRKKLLNIWVPHGNSDKGHASYFMEGLSKEKIALVYGQKMIDFFIEKSVYDQLYATISIGNYRYQFYQEHASFYDKLAEQEIFGSLPDGKRTILYAPTWQDAEKSSSLDMAWPHLMKSLPDDWNLILKLHPNMLHKPHEIERLSHEAEEKENVRVITAFPPVYPLLSRVDLYLGDMSSIGYDFLAFNKPLFFLNQNKRDPTHDKGLYLFRCGISIEVEDYPDIFSLIEENLPDDQNRFQKIREEVYLHVFGKEQKKETLKQKIVTTYEKYLENELHLF